MLPDKIFSLSMTYDGSTADLVAVVTGPNDLVLSKEWWTSDAPTHDDNEWHTVRDILLSFVQEAF